ncbi:MAG: NADH-quinone oxidoreductase subunit N [bacterium]|nr:NADH-quinone oxidoreductase subunit N [bacterium]
MGDFQILHVYPVISLTAFGLLTLLTVPFFRGNTRILGVMSLVGLGTTGVLLRTLWMHSRSDALESAFGMVRIDSFGLYLSFVLLIVGFLTVLASMTFIEREEADHGEFYPLVLFCLAGMFLMLHTSHLMMVLIGLEVFSLSLYVLTGLTRNRKKSIESALKYFLLGAFSSGFIVYGMALLYGAAGSLDMQRIASAAAADGGSMLWIGMGLVLVGLAFKIAVVPFHQWVPDVYEGAPTNVTGFMAAATKTAAFAVLLRFLLGAFGDHSEIWEPLIQWLAVLTMTVANIIALTQTNLKRLLAFSSVAHAGYLLIAVVCRPDEGVSAILFYLTVYAFMTVGAFAVLAAAGRGDTEGERGYTLHDWAGMGWKRPMLGLALMFFLLSLAGIPPTGGFIGKYVIFQAAIHSKQYLLAVIGVLNAAVSVYYYLRVIVAMYMRESETDELPLPVSPATAVVMTVAAAGVLVLGLAPDRILAIVQDLAGALI